MFLDLCLRAAPLSYLLCDFQVQDVGAEKDAITSLRAPTHFGRPNWDKVFSNIVDKHPETDVGVVRITFITSPSFPVPHRPF